MFVFIFVEESFNAQLDTAQLWPDINIAKVIVYILIYLKRILKLKMMVKRM